MNPSAQNSWSLRIRWGQYHPMTTLWIQKGHSRCTSPHSYQKAGARVRTFAPRMVQAE